MSEADDHSIGKPKAVAMSVAEVQSLAERLVARANAIENVATRDLADDLRLTARVVRTMLRYFNANDALTLNGV